MNTTGWIERKGALFVGVVQLAKDCRLRVYADTPEEAKAKAEKSAKEDAGFEVTWKQGCGDAEQ